MNFSKISNDIIERCLAILAALNMLPIYTAYVEQSNGNYTSDWQKVWPQKGFKPSKDGRHLTISYKPSLLKVLQEIMGLENSLCFKVSGYARNTYNEGVSIETNVEVCSGIPHITLGVGQGGKPQDTAYLPFGKCPRWIPERWSGIYGVFTASGWKMKKEFLAPIKGILIEAGDGVKMEDGKSYRTYLAEREAQIEAEIARRKAIDAKYEELKKKWNAEEESKKAAEEARIETLKKAKFLKVTTYSVQFDKTWTDGVTTNYEDALKIQDEAEAWSAYDDETAIVEISEEEYIKLLKQLEK